MSLCIKQTHSTQPFIGAIIKGILCAPFFPSFLHFFHVRHLPNGIKKPGTANAVPSLVINIISFKGKKPFNIFLTSGKRYLSCFSSSSTT